jgi:hypothetical protein
VVKRKFGNHGNGMPSEVEALRNHRLGACPPKNELGMGVDGAASWGAKPHTRDRSAQIQQ